jgi:PAS domain S-box-containing protein
MALGSDVTPSRGIPLRALLVVPFVALIVTAVAFTGTLAFRSGRQGVSAVAQQLHQELTARIEEHLRTFLETPHQINRLNAEAMRHGWLPATDAAGLERHFAAQVQVFESVTSVYFGNPAGGLVNAGREGAVGAAYVIATDGFTSGPLRKYATDRQGNRTTLLATIPRFDARTRPWYVGAVAKRDATWSEIYPLITGQDLAIAASRPVYDARGALLGVVSVDLFLSHLGTFLRNLAIGKTGQAFILERSGLVVATSTSEPPVTAREGAAGPQRRTPGQYDSPLIRHGAAVLADRFGDYRRIARAEQVDFAIAGERHLLHVTPVRVPSGPDWLIAVVIPEADFLGNLQANARTTAGVVLLVLALTLLTGIGVAQGIGRPVGGLVAATRALATGTWTPPGRDRGWIRELRELTHAFSRMAGQLRETVERLTGEVAERTQAEAALAARTTQLEAVREMGAEITRELDLDRLLEHIVRRAMELAGVDSGGLLFWDDAAHRLVPQVYLGALRGLLPTSIALGEGLVGRVAAERRGQFVNDYPAWPGARPEAVTRTSVTATLAEPLLYGERLIGVINLARTEGQGTFTEADAALLRLFADHAAIAIENARLYTAAQREVVGRMDAEARLREREQRLALAIAGSGVGIWDWRVQTGEVTYNERWAEIVGYTLDELAPVSIQTWATLCHPDDLETSNARLQAHFAGTAPVYECEARMRHKAGHWVWVLDRGMVTERAPDGTPLRMTGTHFDVTDRKQLEEERLIRSKLESTGLLAGGIAHDFNNLLTVVLGNLELLEMTPAAERAELLGEMREAVDQAHALTQQFLALSRGEASSRQPVAPEALCRGAVDTALRGSQIATTLDLPADLWRVSGDLERLGVALRNLLVNAKEAMPAGGRLTLSAVNLPGPSRQVRLTLADTGVGIPDAILPKVFDPYFSTKPRGGQRGMGLGLTVARAIVEQHGGTLALTSTAGEGTTVTVTLPAAEATPSVIGRGSSRPGRA